MRNAQRKRDERARVILLFCQLSKRGLVITSEAKEIGSIWQSCHLACSQDTWSKPPAAIRTHQAPLGIALGWAQGIQPKNWVEFPWVEVVFAQRWQLKFLGWSLKFYPHFLRRVLTSKKSGAEFSEAEVPKILTCEKRSSQFSRGKPTDAVTFRVPSKKMNPWECRIRRIKNVAKTSSPRIFSMN